MPRPTLPVFSARAHKPLISFIGKRIWPASSAQSHPHPAAPPEYSKIFSGSMAAQAFPDFWDAPARFWRPKHLELEQSEIDAIQSGGASLH